ncbi:hypothetical protein LINPERPRIM_LOCUS22390, partial [Linum perenne]
FVVVGTSVATPLRSGLSVFLPYIDHLVPGSSFLSTLVSSCEDTESSKCGVGC